MFPHGKKFRSSSPTYLNIHWHTRLMPWSPRDASCPLKAAGKERSFRHLFLSSTHFRSHCGVHEQKERSVDLYAWKICFCHCLLTYAHTASQPATSLSPTLTLTIQNKLIFYYMAGSSLAQADRGSSKGVSIKCSGRRWDSRGRRRTQEALR